MTSLHLMSKVCRIFTELSSTGDSLKMDGRSSGRSEAILFPRCIGRSGSHLKSRSGPRCHHIDFSSYLSEMRDY